MHRRLNRILAAAGVTGALLGGGAALASAASSSTHSRAASSATRVARPKVAHAAGRAHAMKGHCPGMAGSHSSARSGAGGAFQPGAPPQA